FSQPPWSTRRTCAWWASRTPAGRGAATSPAPPHGRCATSSSNRHGARGHTSWCADWATRQAGQGGSMSEPPGDRVQSLFDQAVVLPPEQRAAFLEAACAGDRGLRAEVESLLACDAEFT